MIWFLASVPDGDYSQTMELVYIKVQHTIVVDTIVTGLYGHAKQAELTVSDGDIDSVLTNPHSEPV